ncbi:MAG: 1-deoxy-D-xylulose-5-phosphate reductoisomerase [Bacillota bacterium]
MSVVGSTGSIGRQALDVVRRHSDRFKVVALAARRSVEELVRQALEFRPHLVCVEDEEQAKLVEGQLADARIRVVAGPGAAVEAALIEEADVVLLASSGLSGLRPAVAAVTRGKVLALANKESIVCMGTELLRKAAAYGTRIVPVDSEHSAVFQCLGGSLVPGKEVDGIILTCSGGPFWNVPQSELESVGAREVLRHPVWRMGPKITVDSATLMNKGFEVIEASVLFGLSADRIRVVIHPESIVHAMVLHRDGSALAQLGWPDMRVPIQLALSYPEKLEGPAERFDPVRVSILRFFEPNFEKFPCLKMGFDVLGLPDSYRTVLVAADEVAVELFLAGQLSFKGIPEVIARVMDRHVPSWRVTELDQVEEIAQWAKKAAAEEAARL